MSKKKYTIRYQKFDEDVFTDITPNTIATSLKIRKGFTKLGSSAEVGKATLTFRSTLAESIAFGRDEKVILIEDETGACLFYGYCNSASVEATALSDMAYIKVNVYPFAKTFSLATADTDLVYKNMRVCDPSDKSHSLLHCLSEALYQNIPSKYRDKTSLYTVTDLSILTVLPIVVVKAGESIDEAFNKLLKEYGIARIATTNTATRATICTYIRPYDNKNTVAVPYSSIFSNPTIKTAPYINSERLKVTCAIPVRYDNEMVYQLNDGTVAQDSEYKLTHNQTYPPDDENLKASYGTSERGDLTFLYAVSPYATAKVTKKGGGDAAWYFKTKKLTGTEADLKLIYIGNEEYAYVNNIQVFCDSAYYIDNSLVVEDTETEATISEYTSEFLVNKSDAEYFIKIQQSEKKAETNTFKFGSNKVAFEPNTIVQLGDSDALVLIRYVETDLLTGECSANGVLYDIAEPTVESSIKSKSAVYRNVITMIEYAKGDETSPYGSAIVVADESYIVCDDDENVLGEDTTWSDTMPTLSEGEYLWQRTGSYSPPDTRPSTWNVFRLTGDTGSAGTDGSSVIVATTSLRQYSEATWAIYGATGHVDDWSDIENITDFKLGDIMIINGVITDRGNARCQIYIRVTAKDGTTVTGTTTSFIESLTGNPSAIGGLIADNTLQLGVFDKDGNIGSGSTIIYYQGNSYKLTVDYTSLIDLGSSSKGQGFIGLVNTGSGYSLGAMYIATTASGDSYIPVWTEWSSDGALDSSWVVCVLGEFDYSNGTVAFYQSPRGISDIYQSNFMQILAKLGDGSEVSSKEVDKYVNALGIENFFQSMAVCTAFINKLMANEIVVYNLIKSANYVAPNKTSKTPGAGFMFDSTGNLHAGSAVLGNVDIIGGTADFGSLVVEEEDLVPYSNTESQDDYQAENFYKYFIDSCGFVDSQMYKATCDTMSNVAYAKLTYYTPGFVTTGTYDVFLYDSAQTLVHTININYYTRIGSSGHTSSGTTSINTLTLQTGGNVFKLVDLPTESTGLSTGRVWAGSDGILRIIK